MNNYANKILKYLNKHSSEQYPIELFSLYANFNIDEETFNNSIKYLENNNFIKCLVSYENSSSISSYCSTTLGKEYFKNKSKEKLINVLRYLLFNIISPIIVAYITARITTTNTIDSNDCCNKTDNNRSYNLNSNSN